MLFFAASDFTFITRHIHNWASFLLWPSCFILSGAISSSPPLFPSSILDTFRPVDSSFDVVSVCPFAYFMRFSQQVDWGGLPFPPPVQQIIFCLKSLLWPISLGRPYMAWLIASLSYASPFTMTGQWSVGEIVDLWCWASFRCTVKWFSYAYKYILFYILFHHMLS